MRSCGKELTRKCVVAKLEATTDYKTGLMAPITFPKGERLSNLTGKTLKIDYASKKFVAAE